MDVRRISDLSAWNGPNQPLVPRDTGLYCSSSSEDEKEPTPNMSIIGEGVIKTSSTNTGTYYIMMDETNKKLILKMC